MNCVTVRQELENLRRLQDEFDRGMIAVSPGTIKKWNKLEKKLVKLNGKCLGKGWHR